MVAVVACRRNYSRRRTHSRSRRKRRRTDRAGRRNHLTVAGGGNSSLQQSTTHRRRDGAERRQSRWPPGKVTRKKEVAGAVLRDSSSRKAESSPEVAEASEVSSKVEKRSSAGLDFSGSDVTRRRSRKRERSNGFFKKSRSFLLSMLESPNAPALPLSSGKMTKYTLPSSN